MANKKETAAQTECGFTSFEESVKQLKTIVSRLEDDTVALDDAVDLFSRGIDTLAFCKEKLTQTNAKITELKTGKNGKLVEEILDI